MLPAAFIQRYMLNGNRNFYHFTDRSNLSSIKSNGGLLSLQSIRARGIAVSAPGGNQWSHDADRMSGVDRYVHLCLISEHPMEYSARKDGRIKDTCFIQVSSQVLHMEGIRFTAEVANKSGVKPLTLEEACAEMDFPVLFDRTDWKDAAVQERRKVAKKYELLVPNFVPLHLLSGI